MSGTSSPGAEELEAIESEAWLDMCAAAPEAFAKGAGLWGGRVGSAVLIAIRAAPVIQFNHAHALAVDSSDDALEQIIEALSDRASPVWAIQIPDTPDFSEVRRRLASRGFSANGGWAKFWRSADLPSPSPTTLTLNEIGTEQAAEFGRVVQLGFGAPPPFAMWAAAIVGRPRWRCYLACDDGIPVAAAALFLHDGLGWLGLHATIESHRGRGAQGALMNRSIADAVAAGVRGLVTETGRPPPGEEASHPSYRNIRRAGFADLYLRENWRPPQSA